MDTIFNFLDYREYLRAHFDHNKRCHRFFSFRYVAIKTGLDASFYFKVLKKQKHIANTAIPTLVTFCKLTEDEGIFFSHLVLYNKAKAVAQKTFYLHKIYKLQQSAEDYAENKTYKCKSM